MQLTGEKLVMSEVLKKSAVTMPEEFYGDTVFERSSEKKSFYTENENTIAEIWNNQHPLIHTWLILSSISICFLSAFLFMVN
ncbi:MAG: hypothetical protein PHC64_05480 [Candidatus Gastranaerophilales bacterium]|nr:hypothetical protein [Candidatus Gastranaerophilales bacterium]